MLGGGIAAAIAAMAVGIAVHGYQDKKLSVTSIAESAEPALAASAPKQSSQRLNLTLKWAEEKALRERDITLKAGDTLMGVLLEAGISRQEADASSSAMEKVYDPRDLRAGQMIKLIIRDEIDSEENRCLERIEFVPETDRLILIKHDTHDTFSARVDTVPHVSKLVAKSGKIGSSFYKAARAAGVPNSILLESYGTLSRAFDFQRDFRVGDSFELGFQVYDDGPGRGQHPGELVYASIDVRDQSIRAYRYTTSDGFTGFFNESGVGLSTSLLKAPVNGARLSSLFGKRKHPVLGYTRMHRGLDFGASHGVPVLAAGDGIVVQRERNGNYGKYIRISHDATYSTAYAHLSRYADKLKSGDRVQQGDVIGYVGSTGLATGPNLHYEVLQGSRQVNPMKVELPPRRLLGEMEKARFEREKEKIRSLITFQSTRAPSRQALRVGQEGPEPVALETSTQRKL